ncbi:MAG TPA: EAL domain-containing protein [Steroidobacteraceae bacterium]|jgi:diguanylate cyclase (GGDEF)-like protein|nr:EAL domain-containing protein [Steroidobacteraceae bacterium]
MAVRNSKPIRVLVVDDEPEIRDAYRQILSESEANLEMTGFHELRSRLFRKNPEEALRRAATRTSTAFEAVFCEEATQAVAAVKEALGRNEPFAVVFLDVRMPPGPDGVWAATQIRELDPAIEIVICTAYSDADPGEIGGLVPPEDKLSYLQKPFHPHEVRQMAIALGSKWRAERRIVRLAYFDTLTGLPNRMQSHNRLVGALQAAKEKGGHLAVLYLDLDNFKRVNDTLGHAVGDELLCVVADRLRSSLRYGNDSTSGSNSARVGDIARLGGDEFMVLLPNLRTTVDAGAVAERLILALREPIQLASNSLVVTPSIGIAIYPQDGIDAETLLRNADLAMYFAKRRSPGTHAYFDVSMNATALHRFTIEEQLRGALARNEFSLQYQPQFDVRTGTISGIEALLRWTNTELGAVSPLEFIPVAEETGLILAIGKWVLRTACEQAQTWRAEGLPVNRMAVNVSGRQFALAEYPNEVAEILKETGLDPAVLELEITESVVMADEVWAEKAINQLKALGISLAIDDFGTGYSSFGRLRHFAVDRLKIDRSFVTSISEGSDDRAIAAAIIAMSRSLRISVTAEGVENFPQLTFLQEQECQDAQGFLLSRPLQADAARELLRRVNEIGDASRTQRLKIITG